MYSTCLSLYNAAEGAVTTGSVGRRPSLMSSLTCLGENVVLIDHGLMMVRVAVATAVPPSTTVSDVRLHRRNCDVDFDL